MTPLKTQVLIALSFFAIYVIWGSTFLAIRWSLEGLPPLLVGALRFSSAGVLLLLAVGWKHRRTLQRPQASTAIFTGVLMAGIANGLVIWAEKTVPSGTAALWIATVPIWILLLNWVRFERKQPRAQALLGALVGVIGISFLASPAEDTGSLVGTMALLASALVWSFGTLYQRTHPGPGHPFVISSVQMISAGVFLGLAALVCGEGPFFLQIVQTPSTFAHSLGAVAYLSLFGSVLAFTAYSWLVKTVDPQKVATYALVNPVIALALGGGMAGELVSPRLVFVAVMVLIGVALILARRRPGRGVFAWRAKVAACTEAPTRTQASG